MELGCGCGVSGGAIWSSKCFSFSSPSLSISPFFAKRAFLTQQEKRGLFLRRHLRSISTSPRCQKMFVPGFGEASPEANAAKNLHNFFTYIAVKIVLAQLESYNPEAHGELMEFVNRHSLDDGDKFCGNLMRESPRHQALALRILEVRSAYAKQDFEWENLKRVAFMMVDKSNTRLMREYVLETSQIEDEK